MHISSRPDTEDITVEAFDLEELQVIAAFMHITRLGKGSTYKQAAFRILSKICDHLGDDFSQEAHEAVALEVRILDTKGSFVETFTNEHVEFEL